MAPVASHTMRVRPETHSTLKNMAEKCGVSMQDLLDKLVADHERQEFLAEFERSFEDLRRDPDAWRELQRERAEWDSTLVDGSFR